DTIFVVQARPITALPEPAGELSAAPAEQWHLPDPHGRYLRGSVIELLPDPLSPLFATLGLPAWNQAYDEFVPTIGLPVRIFEYGLTTLNGYAYYKMTLTLAQEARFVRYLPRFVLRAFG